MLRVVLHAEGGLETTGSITVQLAPGQRLDDASLGAAHLLLRRALCRVRQLPEADIQFEVPLRLPQGRIARGSDLLVEANLKRLLQWPRPEMRPELAVVMVDRDGETQRGESLRAVIARLQVPPLRVVAVAVEEFEAWLIADGAALNVVLRTTVDATPDPEGLPRTVAKRRLREWIERSGRSPEETLVRRELAARIDLETLGVRCGSYRAMEHELRGTH